MPPVDLETLVSSVCAGGSDRKIACETLAVSTNTTTGDQPDDLEDGPGSVSVPPNDFPPESFFLSKEDEIDWLNQNAFYERKESQKGNSARLNPNPNSSSQHSAFNAKAFIIGLPKPQKTCFNEAKIRRQQCKMAQTRLLADLIGSRGKKGPPLSEPSSPKVSCIGRVGSKRSRRMRRQKSGRSDPIKNKSGPVKKLGFLSSFRAIFRGRKDVLARGSVEPPVDTRPSTSAGTMTHDIRRRLPPDDVDAISEPRRSAASRNSFDGEPVGIPGLGGMRRFASGRREDLLTDVDVASSVL